MEVINLAQKKKELLKERELLKKYQTNSNLALKLDEFDEDEITYSKPQVGTIHILEPKRKVFMSCWNVGCNEDNNGDGC